MNRTIIIRPPKGSKDKTKSFTLYDVKDSVEALEYLKQLILKDSSSKLIK